MATDAKQFDFLISGLCDASGNPLSGAIIVTKDSSGASPKAVWEDKDMTLPGALGKSQFTLDATGKAVVFGDGVYTILVYAATDTGLTSPIATFSGVSYAFEQSTNIAAHAALTTGVHGVGAGDVVGTALSQTLTNKVLTAPTINDPVIPDDEWTNAVHAHGNAAGGGSLASAIVLDKPAIADFTNAAHLHVGVTSGGVILPVGYLYGLSIANNAADKYDLDISAGKCLDSANASAMSLSSALTKQIDASWAAGTNQGGRAAGVSLVNGTWYRVFLVAKTDGTTDVIFDTSATAANAPAGYTIYRHIGWVYYVDSTTKIRKFHQYGDLFQWDARQETGYFGVSHATFVDRVIPSPPDSIAQVSGVNGSTAPYVTFRSTSEAHVAASFTNNYPSGPVMTNSSSQITVTFGDAIGGDNYTIEVSGWTDFRGREG